jgi:hypothetical protein
MSTNLLSFGKIIRRLPDPQQKVPLRVEKVIGSNEKGESPWRLHIGTFQQPQFIGHSRRLEVLLMD